MSFAQTFRITKFAKGFASVFVGSNQYDLLNSTVIA